MAEPVRPTPLDTRFGTVLRSIKADFVRRTGDGFTVVQCGAAHIPPTSAPGWPGWPDFATDSPTTEAVIETFVCGPGRVDATSANEPFVAAWRPLAEWMNAAVRRQLSATGVDIDGDAFLTASITPTSLLDGAAHMDDDIYDPDAGVGVVAIVGELAGPRVAVGSIDPVDGAAPRPMTQLDFGESALVAFSNAATPQCCCEADQLIVFPQFGQLHRGPDTQQVAGLSPTRQLLVLRASSRSRLHTVTLANEHRPGAYDKQPCSP